MTGTSPFLPETVEPVLDEACRAAGLDPTDAPLLRLGENILYQLSSAPVVVRIARDMRYWDSAAKEIAVADWLRQQGFPAARYAEVVDRQPLEVHGHPVTFWQFIPGRPAELDEAGHLGALLRRLHQLDRPHIALPAVTPFDRVLDRLAAAPIPLADKQLLTDRVDTLERELPTVRFQLPEVAIHGDAHVKNVMVTEGAVTLIDLEAFTWGPAEWDLAKTAAEARMGMIGARDYEAFVSAYGYDVTSWSGWSVLLGIQQVLMVSWLAQNIDHSDRIAAEYRKRITTIRTGRLSEPWRGF